MWYLAPGRAMKTTTRAARKDPRHADTKDCCHVYVPISTSSPESQHRRVNIPDQQLPMQIQCSSPQWRTDYWTNKGANYTYLISTRCTQSCWKVYIPCPSSVLLWRWLQVFVGPFCIANDFLTFFALWSSGKVEKGILRSKRRAQLLLGRKTELPHDVGYRMLYRWMKLG